MPLTIIELDAAQANFFALCNQQFKTINFMAQSGVFQIRNGNAVLAFNSEGTLKSIKRELFDYAGDILS